jgi:two-component system, OmpR family, response regulator
MKKVLIVDDTKNIRNLLTTCLEIEGYEATTANDGFQALKLLFENYYDLAFIDIKMPEISGTEVLKKMRENNIATPVIIMTAFATVKNAIDCTNMGAVAYVQKPFSADKIRTVLKELEDKFLKYKLDNSVDKLIYEARVSLDIKEYAKALELSQKALSIELDNSEIYYLISKAFEGLGETENAVRYYRFYNSFNL